MVQRVLCFPGYGESAKILDIKMTSIKKHCAGKVEFVYIEPCYTLYARDGGDIPAPDAEPVEVRRAWGIPTDEEHTRFDGVEDMVIYVRDWLASQTVPFDGVFGFSQGAGTASLIACLLEDPTRYPAFLINGKPPHPPMKFAVLVSGAGPVDSQFTKFYEGAPLLKTPALHVIGRTDTVVSWKRSKALIDAYDSPRVEWHDGCHFIPTKASWREFFLLFITGFQSPEPVVSTKELESPAPVKVLPWTYYTQKRRVTAN